MAVPSLGDYEYQYDEASNGGILLNDDAAGIAASLPFIDITNVSGLDSAEFRTATSQHEGVDGSWIDSDFMQTRTIVIDGVIYASPTNAEPICDSLKGNFEPGGDKAFYFKHPGANQRFCYGKSQGVRYDIASLRRTGQTAMQATIVCGDPYIYDVTFTSTRTANTSGNLNPGGNHNAWPIVTVTGPCSSGYTVRNNTLGRILTLNQSLSAGQTLVINMRKRTVMLNGTANRRGIAAGQFWWLNKNTNNSLQFTVSGSTGATTMVTAGNATYN